MRKGSSLLKIATDGTLPPATAGSLPLPCSRRGDDTCMPSQASGTNSGQRAGQIYSLALAADNLLVALEAGSGRQVACFTISGPEQAADPAFQSWLRQQLEGPTAVPWQHTQHAQHAERALAASASGGPAGPDSEDEELAGLLQLMMVGDSSSLTSAAAAAEGGGAAAPRADETSALSSAGQHPSYPAELWFDALEEPATDGWQLDEFEWRQLQQQAGEGWGAQQRQQHSISWQEDEAEDWRLAALLQAEEDASVTPAAAEQAEASVAGQQLLQLSDWRLAQRFQEEEDARMAAALAEQDRAAGTSAAQAVAQQSSSFWARLQPGGGASVAGGCGVSEAGTAPAAASDSFPALQAQLPADQLAATRAERTRRQLLSEHRQAKQAAMQRGSSVRLLRRVGGAGSPAASPVLAATAVLPSSRGSGISVGLPPLQLDGGLVLHEDDLDYQLLLRVRLRYAPRTDVTSPCLPTSLLHVVAAGRAVGCRARLRGISLASARLGAALQGSKPPLAAGRRADACTPAGAWLVWHACRRHAGVPLALAGHPGCGVGRRWHAAASLPLFCRPRMPSALPRFPVTPLGQPPGCRTTT